MTRFLAVAAVAAGLLYALPAISEPCADANALGTSRTLAVDPARLSRIGTMQYRETVALAPKEVVLTFDDGPMQPMTSKVLEALRAECVNATFFLVGRYARAHPEVVREIARDGHTIANHTENHPLVTMGEAHGIKEFETGFFSVATVLEPVHVSPAPFIRFPGLFSTAGVEAYAKRKGLTVMSADLLADDWLRIPAEQIFVRAMARLSQKGSGILLLHDVQPGTALILPKLLNELKTRGYRIVHLVPAPGTDPVIAAAPLVAEKPAPPPPVRHAVHRHVAAKPIDASNIHTAAEAIGHDKTSAASDNKVPRASVSTITPVAASAGALPEGTIFGRWRKTMQERRGAVAITRPEP